MDRVVHGDPATLELRSSRVAFGRGPRLIPWIGRSRSCPDIVAWWSTSSRVQRWRLRPVSWIGWSTSMSHCRWRGGRRRAEPSGGGRPRGSSGPHRRHPRSRCRNGHRQEFAPVAVGAARSQRGAAHRRCEPGASAPVARSPAWSTAPEAVRSPDDWLAPPSTRPHRAGEHLGLAQPNRSTGLDLVM